MNQKFRKLSYTISMYLFSHLIAFISLPIGLILITAAPKTAPKLKQWFTSLLFWFVGKRANILGKEYVDDQQHYLIIANYPSFYAGFGLINVFPTASIVAHAFISKIPVLGHVLCRAGAVFVDPKKMKRTKETLDSAFTSKEFKQDVIIFPEGERTDDGNIKRFRRGFIYILRQSDLLLLPVTLNGFFSLKPVSRSWLDPDAEISVQIHPPISRAEIDHMTDQELLDRSVESIVETYKP